MPTRTYTFTTLLILTIATVSGLGWSTSKLINDYSGIPVFSSREMVDSLWSEYKKFFIDTQNYRTLDPQTNNITTSEGQSYTMLRAVWMDDKETFDKSWDWTKNNIKRPNDNLFAWLYGKKDDGSFGIITSRGGENSAQDADTDIALSLIFASKKWGQNTYLEDARNILKDIWNLEIINLNQKNIVLANNVEKRLSTNMILNPSYFAPYAYRIFKQVDPNHDWLSLVDSSYEILKEATETNLDKNKSVNLPPNWVGLNRNTGRLVPLENSSLNTNYGFDALRTAWRISLDWFWFKEPRAKSYLESLNFLTKTWTENGKIYAEYTHDGEIAGNYESQAMYGGAIGYFLITDPENALNIYRNKIKPLYDPDNRSWYKKLGYYDDNWAWFGLALYHGYTINLAEDLPK